MGLRGIRKALVPQVAAILSLTWHVAAGDPWRGWLYGLVVLELVALGVYSLPNAGAPTSSPTPPPALAPPTPSSPPGGTS